MRRSLLPRVPNAGLPLQETRLPRRGESRADPAKGARALWRCYIRAAAMDGRGRPRRAADRGWPRVLELLCVRATRAVLKLAALACLMPRRRDATRERESAAPEPHQLQSVAVPIARLTIVVRWIPVCSVVAAICFIPPSMRQKTTLYTRVRR